MEYIMELWGKRLKQFRNLKKMSQSEVARAANVSNEYIGKIEREEVENIGTQVVDAIAKAINVHPQDLLFKSIYKEPRPYPMELDKIVDMPLLLEGVRPLGAEDAPYYKPHDLPEIGLVQAGRGGFFDNQGFPMGEWPKKYHRPNDVKDPNAYVVRVEGDSMEPALTKGNRVICVTNQEAIPGDWVVVQLKNDEFMIKELSMRDGMIILKSINPLHEPIVLNKKEIRAIHPVVWIKRK